MMNTMFGRTFQLNTRTKCRVYRVPVLNDCMKSCNTVDNKKIDSPCYWYIPCALRV